jgi:hypothetical protein
MFAKVFRSGTSSTMGLKSTFHVNIVSNSAFTVG